MTTVSGKDLYLWRQSAKKQAIAAQVSAQEVDWLLQEITTLDSLALRLESFQNYSEIAIAYSLPRLSQLWQQRLDNHFPLQYLVGQTTWRNWRLLVAPGVLIPRPETELMIEIVQQIKLTQQIQTNWVDLGTGSGAIAIALAAAFPQAQIHAVDLSSPALEIARRNANLTNQAHKIQFYQGSWWQPLSHLRGKVTGMISNPPYIPTQDLPQLQPEVFQHEPHLALDGGKDGLAAIAHLVATAPQYLRSQGVWLSEIMAGQASDVVKMLSAQGDYYDIEVIKDLSGIERFVLAYRQ